MTAWPTRTSSISTIRGILLIAISLTLLNLTSCGLFSQTNSAPPLEEPSLPPLDEKDKVATTETEEALPPKPFSQNTLLSLLIGELAVYDRDIATAAANYRREANITRDIGVTERAARLARYLNDIESATELAELWYELDPTSRQAGQNLADLYARNQAPLEAVAIFEEMTQSGHKPSYSVLRSTKYRSKEQRQAVIDRLEQLTDANTDPNFSLVLTRTVLLQQNGQVEAALKQLKQLDSFETSPVQRALIESQLLSELERHKESSEVLSKALRKNPDEKRLRLEYARKLTKHSLPRAQTAFADLLKDYPDDKDILMGHALVAFENEDYLQAKNTLQQMLKSRINRPFAHYQLGQVAVAEENLDLALSHFRQVQRSDFLLPAVQASAHVYLKQNDIETGRTYLRQLRGNYPLLAPTFWRYEAKLLEEAGQIGEAHSVLTVALDLHPEQHHLRQQRAFLSEKLDLLKLVEYDLTYILKRDPNSANALNALGYILADRTDRYDEAFRYIEKALVLIPENPAILDSMGWVLYKRGKVEEGLEYLHQAFDILQDQEVASHLIHIYLEQGETGKARKIYRELRKETTEHPMVDAVLKKFNARL